MRKTIMGYDGVSFDKNTTFLITGGAGFIGSNLCDALISMGYKVRCLDNLSTGTINNLEYCINNSNFDFIEGDIRDFNTCEKACYKTDYVLHQANWGSVPRSIEIPLFYCENNIMGTLNMMEAARVSKVKKFVYASSSSVYGDNQMLIKNEGNEGRLLSPYALTKRCTEEWAYQYHINYNLSTVGLRYFNVFGRKQNPTGPYAAVIPKFIKQLLSNERPTIFGDGTQSRDFTYIENVIEANIKACLSNSCANGKVFNIAFGKSTKILDVYYMISKALGINLQPIFSDKRKGDILNSCADIHSAKKELGYNPSWSFEKGIIESIEWYKNFIGRSV